jgi:integrase
VLLTETVERYIIAKGLTSAHSIRNQRKHAAALVTYLGRDPELTELDDEALARYWKEREKVVSRNSVSTEASLLLAVLKWASHKRWCEWPDAIPPGRTRKLPQALTIEQTVKLLETASTLTGAFRGVPACVRWRAYLLLSLRTAERIGAIRQMRWSDIAGNVVTFRSETRKGGSVETAHVLPPVVLDALADLQSYGEPTPFGWVERTAVYAHWAALRQIADLPEWVRPHTLRKTAATHCATLEQASRLLGHSSPTTTKRNYRDPRIVEQAEPESELMRALSKPKRSWLGRRLGWTG